MGKPARIMIVEDERIIAEDLKMSLEKASFEVVAIESRGETAIEKAGSEMPDLILMDIMLKGEIDGIEAGLVIRKRHQIPIVYLTSYCDHKTVERAKETSPFGYLIKPFNDRELETTIEIALYKDAMEKERERLIRELQEALARIQTLEGLLPICAWCKKIRDDDGYWQELWQYVSEHSKAKFTHGICEQCLREKFPEAAAGPAAGKQAGGEENNQA